MLPEEKRPVCVECGKKLAKNPFAESLVNGIGLGAGFAVAGLAARLLLPEGKKK